MTQRRLKFWGWGYEDQTLTEDDSLMIVKRLNKLTGLQPNSYLSPPSLSEINLPKPRSSVPNRLSHLVSQTDYDRASHTYGKSYPDYIRAFAKDFSCCPDSVCFPETNENILELLEWGSEINAAIIPFGCGSSVVGGIEPRVGDKFSSVITIDMRKMNQVLEIDKTSRAARIQAGALGPQLEAGLKKSGLTLRHFPQSFEFSTLGGWIATRSGGHFATLYPHIDELVESLVTVTPKGVMESRRLPGSGAGPSPDRLIIGSEGSLGLITEAWMRVHSKPEFRKSAVVRFKNIEAAGQSIRSLLQAGLWPSNARFVDSEECRLAGVNKGDYHMVVIGFENSEQPVDTLMNKALECMEDHGGVFGIAGERDKTADIWRNAFISAPFKREGLISYGIMHDTFETSITWDKLSDFHENIKLVTEQVIKEVTGKPGHVTCRFTHAYTDGTAPYFTFHAETKPGQELEQWREIKTAVGDALLSAGGTITHHHAVGRDHMPWYERQRPQLFGGSLKAVKNYLDPESRLNPGVIIPLDKESSLP
tara:strand:- start:5193 stop:6797 length:1605 start_codon:yes stop_codon:yes gene_type:complete